MNGTKLNAKVWAGYAKAAKKIGTPYQHYRPSSASNPLAAGNRLADLPVSLNAEDPRFARPNVYGKPTWYAIADGSQLKVGDYIVGIEGTLFVAALQQLLPIFMVDCNRTISILRETRADGFGQLPYGGDTPDIEQPLMAGWPASVLQGPKGEKNETGLPGDVRTPWWAILLPAWPTVTIRTSDIITDDLGRRYIVSSAELTDLGWRLTATQKQV
ncbi:hypothetical protein BUE93_20785 [Chromobacterium amazonense]|uniref:Uncharacterized protein n=1 Tax=Chromobacterium amazonense TaxID=1382803 RepID=A0A2S9WZ16_9NEIS|nr:hypothetical protein [Chromobacterium amazonense]PRP68704.1 hypothetical protein BUE93_20785 [Chromobacterium amazonense]